MVYIDKPLLPVFSANNAERLVKIRYNKLMLEAMGPFAIVIFQPYTLTVDEHTIQKRVAIDRATFASRRALFITLQRFAKV